MLPHLGTSSVLIPTPSPHLHTYSIAVRATACSYTQALGSALTPASSPSSSHLFYCCTCYCMLLHADTWLRPNTIITPHYYNYPIVTQANSCYYLHTPIPSITIQFNQQPASLPLLGLTVSAVSMHLTMQKLPAANGLAYELFPTFFLLCL